MRPSAPRAVVAVVAAVVVVPGVALAVPGCWSGTPHPAELGGCVGTPEAGCTTGNSAGGSGGSAHDGGAADARADAEDLDGGLDSGVAALCGEAESVLAARSALCATCLGVGAEAGAAPCCAAETTCSADPSCLYILQCELNQSCTPPPQGAAAYNALGRCLLLACPDICPLLVPVPEGDP